MSNKNLHKAKAAKNDEFYTRYEDIEKEVEEYYKYNNDVFRDKVILCPCDYPDKSEFEHYFLDNFERFGLRKLIISGIDPITKEGKVRTYTRDEVQG